MNTTLWCQYFIIYAIYVAVLSLFLVFPKIYRRGAKRRTYLCGEVLPLSFFKMEAENIYRPFIEIFEGIREIELKDINNKLHWMLLFFIALTSILIFIRFRL